MDEGTLKPGWKRWRFDEMAVSVGDRIHPDDAEVEHYVGLEHLDSDSLKIRQWGSPSEVNATKLRFKKGDIIFGRRRVYQRKLAVADFDGICSAHAMVLRPKTDVVLPEFLPFFMQSDLFMNRALEISVGSLSPTINWKTLARQTFALPPLEEQRKFVHALSTVEKLLESFFLLNRKGLIVESAYIEKALDNFTSASRRKLEDLADVSYGLTVNRKRRKAPKKAPYLRVANVQRGDFDFSEVKEIGLLEGDESYVLEKDDILIVEGHANPEELGRAAIWKEEINRCLHQNHLIRVRCGKELDSDFIAEYMNSTLGRKHFLSHAKSTSGLNTINSKVVRKVPIPNVPIEKQREIVMRIKS